MGCIAANFGVNDITLVFLLFSKKVLAVIKQEGGVKVDGIWIRSQDKTSLVFTRSLHFNKHYLNEGIRANNAGIWLGVYWTERRAIEVMDEIQDKILHDARVYQMPEE